MFINKMIKESFNTFYLSIFILSFLLIQTSNNAQTITQDFDGSMSGWTITQGGTGTEGDDNNNAPVTGTTWKVTRPSSIGSSLSAPSSPNCIIVGKKDAEIAYDYFFSPRLDNISRSDEITVSFKHAVHYSDGSLIRDAWAYIYILKDMDGDGRAEPLGADASGLDAWNGYSTESTWKSTSETISAGGDIFIGIRAHVPKLSAWNNKGNTYLLIDDLVITVEKAQAAIEITSPSGGEEWIAGSTQQIKWKINDNSVSAVNIRYTTDGSDYKSVASNISASTGSYNWTVPNDPSSTVKIIVASTDIFSGDFAESNLFTITGGSTGPSITVVTPNGGERWSIGSKQTIQWNSNGINTVSLWINRGTSGEYIVQNINNTGSYSWTVPNWPGSYKIKVEGDGASDESNATFEIYESIEPEIYVVTPNGGENWEIGSKQEIKWTSSGIEMVTLQWSINGEDWTAIGGSFANSPGYGTYTWTVPPVYTSKSTNGLHENCYIKIYNFNGFDTFEDKSDAPFTISERASVNLISPNGNEKWEVGSQQQITWDTKNVSKVDLFYSIDGGETKTLIASSIDADKGSFNWTVPNIETSEIIIIIDANNWPYFDQSENTISIVPETAELNLISPRGGETFYGNSVVEIKWNSSGLEKIKIIFYDGSSNTTIAENIDATLGLYNWTIPNVDAIGCRIYIKDQFSNDYTDTHDYGYLTIKKEAIPNLSLLSPNGGEKLYVADQYNITWNSENISKIKLRYSTDFGNSWNLIAENVDAYSGKFEWTLPNINSTQMLVEISDQSEPTLIDVNDKTFTILQKPIYEITAPSASEIVYSGFEYEIKWNSTNGQLVDIYYQVAEGNPVLITDSLNASSGSYAWMVPSINSTEVTIKLVDNSDDQFFTISEKFEVTEPTFISLLNPNGGEVFNTGEQIVIGWKANFTPVVKIEFTSNSGGSWNEITTVNNGSTYNWTAPNLAGNNYKIKVTELNAPYPSVDESDADFEIKEGDQNADKIITYRENDSEGVPLHLGETVTISGIVTVDDQFGETGPVYIQDETAGISIYGADYQNQLSMSDEVSITGIVNQYNGLTQITEVVKIEVISTNNPVEVSEVSIGEILTQDWNGVERLEGKLVKLKEVNFQQTGEFAPNANYQVSDGSNSIPIRIDNDVQDVAGIPIPESNVDIVGVVSQFKNSKPYDSGYQIFIRGIADIKIPVNKEIELLKPNGGEKLYAGEDYLITWEAENVETISIELSTNNGQLFTTIIDEAPSGTNYKFRVPKTLLSKECLLRISDSKNSQISSISKSVFEIAPPFPENVNPMITAKWKTFTWPLNAYYPEDDNGINGHVGNACGPTAIAHILKYWEYPKRGDGYLKFTDRENHVWEANFGETIYNYQNMPDVIPGSAQESVYSETAKLMLHSMVATNDKYGSGMRINDLNESFQNYFLFSDSSEVLYREDFNETEWLIFFKEELAEGRPVFVEGWTANSTPPGQSGNHEGHYFLVDGYNDQNQFHVVWNFGDFDGYFDLYDFGDYDEYNWIIKGLKPGNIQIQPELELVSPQGGEIWNSGQTAKILWNSKNINQVGIEMSTDAGNTWILLGDNISASSGEFEWEVQDLYSQSCVIRIFDSNNKSFEDRNENFFTIQNKKSFGGPYSNDENTILLMHFDNNYNYSSIASNSIAKDHGAGLSFEESHRIDLSSCLRIDNSRNDGTSVSVTHFDDLNLGENWTIEMWVKVNVFGSGTTSFPFILIKPANSGNFWESNYSIGINSNFDAFYSEYYSGNSSAGIVFGDRDQVTNNGDWYHIAFIRDVDKGKIALIMHDKEGRRISKREAAINVNLTPNFSTKDLQIGGFSTQSNAQFDGWVDELRISDTVREYGYVRLSAPNGGEILNNGSLYQISWETSGIEKINLYYSSNNGSNWNLIQANVDASLGSYNWQTPDVSSTEYMLKIESAENVSIYDISDSPFTISVISDLEKITEAIPEEWKLFQNFPNPFNPTTQIRFSVKEEGNTKLVVYNLLGQEITILSDKFATPGNYDVSFDASGLESGMYFYRLFSGSYLETRKMLLIK